MYCPKANQIHDFCVIKYSFESSNAFTGCMPKQAIFYTLHSSSSNNDIVMLGKSVVVYSLPTLSNIWKILPPLLGKLTVPTEHVLAPISNDVK